MLPKPFDWLPDTARRTIELPVGGFLFRQNDSTRGLFYLVSGRVELERVTGNGDPVVIHRALPGETFAEASLFSATYHCDAVAQAPTQVVELRRDPVMQRFRRDVDFAAELAGRFAVQVQTARRRLELMAIRSAEERVLAAISDDLLGHSIKRFAAEIGLTHEATYRALARLVKRGLLRKTGRGRYSLNCP